jgi:hypothetical protein
MTEGDLLEHIFERLCRADAGEEIFGGDEAAEWPAGVLDVLTEAGLLRPAPPAQVVECDGCERNCFMPVNVRPTEGGRPAQAFISCDKLEDVGRVPVGLQRREQRRITGSQLACAVARLLGFTKPQQEDGASGKRWKLGLLKGKEHIGEAKLAIETGVVLIVAGHTVPLAEIVKLSGRGMSADKAELLRLVDQPASPPGVPRYQPSVTRRESRKLDTQERYAAWRKAAKELRRKPQGKSERWVSHQIAKTSIANGCSAETIRKRIRH